MGFSELGRLQVDCKLAAFSTQTRGKVQQVCIAASLYLPLHSRASDRCRADVHCQVHAPPQLATSGYPAHLQSLPIFAHVSVSRGSNACVFQTSNA